MSTENIQIGIKKPLKICSKEQLESLSKDELIERLLSLQAHNQQLKNILAKVNNGQSKKCDKNVKNKAVKGFDEKKYIYRHILLKFFYLGWDYKGYVVQEDTTNTIEHHLFEALQRTCLIKNREESNYHRCGRTDKGVSSFSQVISIDVRSKLNEESIEKLDEEHDYCSILNKVLPETIQCVGWCPVEKDFSARFNCQTRTYKYFFPKGTLNVEKMQEGAKFMLGTHDFRNLCKMDVANGVTEFVRKIDFVEICKFDDTTENDAYSMYEFTIQSKGFLWHQIRCIMGVLFLIGENNEQPEIIQELLDIGKNSRKPDYNMACETPLNLFHCCYEIDGNWRYNSATLSAVVKKLQSMWTLSNVKSTMIKAMLSELESIQSNLAVCQQIKDSIEFVNSLNQDNKSKRYIPLMERPKCDSLEDKIDHYLKRRRIEIKTPGTREQKTQ